MSTAPAYDDRRLGTEAVDVETNIPANCSVVLDSTRVVSDLVHLM